MNGKRLSWDNIRHGAGLVFLTYLVFWNPEGIPIWVGALIAGLLGLQDVFSPLIGGWLSQRRNGGAG